MTSYLNEYVQSVMKDVKDLYSSSENLVDGCLAVTVNTKLLKLEEVKEALIESLINEYKVKKTQASKFVNITELDGV